MKKEIIEVFLILSVCGIILNGCEQKLHLDLKTQSPVPVVNSILMAGDDSVRVQVTWTKNVYEQGDFPVEANASVNYTRMTTWWENVSTWETAGML